MNIYASQYTNVYPISQASSLLFHGITGAIDEVQGGFSKFFNTYKRSKESVNQQLTTMGMKESQIEFLVQRGHLTYSHAALEHEAFKHYADNLHDSRNSMKENSGLLMLVPSYYCNLACHYCFQNTFREQQKNNMPKPMTARQVDQIFSKSLKLLFPKILDYSKLHIKLYGGEPFLDENYNAIERIIDYTKELKIKVSSISNASKLESFIKFFGAESGLIQSVQISFDGDKLHHDQSRITHYGGGTFDAIIANMKKLIDQGTTISIRANTNSKTVTSLPILIDQLNSENILSHKNVAFYGAAIHSHINGNGKFPFTKNKLNAFVHQNNLPIRSPYDILKQSLSPLFAKEKFSKPERTNFCMQNSPQSFLIDNSNDIYGCYEEAGMRHLRIGELKIETGEVSFNNRYAIYQKRHVGEYEPCSKCSIALTCGGGCPVAARGNDTSPNSIFKNYCDSQKEMVSKGILELYKEKQNAIQA